MMTVADASPGERPTPHPKMTNGGPKRLLALDGGGIRGMITLQMLAELERVLRAQRGADEGFRLSDYFDYVAGTSTGAIIATCVSLGMSVAQIQAFYEANGTAMFDKASLLQRFRFKYHDEKLAEKLRQVFDDYLPAAERQRGDRHVTLGSAALKTLLLIVMRNATTDSPWPLSNNPWAKYNDPRRPDSNLGLPLWQLVRASTAAPTFFPPELVQVGEHPFLFVDGGVTMYNNPAFLLFLMSTVSPYRLEWPTGPERMLLVSVGTGTAASANEELSVGDMNLMYNATSIPGALMYAALNEQDTLCRVFGRCRAGARIDRDLGTLVENDGVSPSLPKLFTYVRYNADLTQAGLQDLGVGHLAPEDVQKMDSVEHIAELIEVGRAARRQIVAGHFTGFA